MPETQKALAAFEAYWALGYKRSAPLLGVQLGISARRVRQWAHAYDWDTRIRQRILETAALERAEQAERERARAEALAQYEHHLLEEGTKLFDDAVALVRRQIKANKVTGPAVMALDQARTITLRGLREPATITRTEQTGAGGGPVEQEVLIRQYVGIDIALASGERAAGDGSPLPPVGGSQDALSRARP